MACPSLSLSWGVHRLEPLLEPLALARAEALAGGGVLMRFSCSWWFCLRSSSAEARASSALRRTSETGVPRGARAGVCGVGGAATTCITRGSTVGGMCSTAEPAAARSALFSRACTVRSCGMGDFGQAPEHPPRPRLVGPDLLVSTGGGSDKVAVAVAIPTCGRVGCCEPGHFGRDIAPSRSCAVPR
jgi:hypothetical protein